MADINKFLTTRHVYKHRQIPYRRGYLLQGIPGSGKSSLVLGIASALRAPVYILTLTDRALTDQDVLGMLGEIPAGGILLLEDIDAAIHTDRAAATSEKESGGVTLSGLLNSLDGVAASEGRVLFMTTNYPEKLDAALVRRGRIDKVVVFTHTTQDQAEQMFLRFFPDEFSQACRFGRAISDKAAAGHNYSMADLQELLNSAEDSPEKAIISLAS